MRRVIDILRVVSLRMHDSNDIFLVLRLLANSNLATESFICVSLMKDKVKWPKGIAEGDG